MKPGIGTALALLFLVSTASVSLVQSGQYAKFAAESGGIGDILARSLGLGVKAIVITTDNGMTPGQILPATGITQLSSTLFLNADAIRTRLLALPRIKQAAVRVLYPDRVVIDIQERRPFAIWQDNGKLSVISADGTPIETASSRRWAGLPFVVGPQANMQIGDFAKLIAVAPTLKSRIRAGVLVSGRRWDLKMSNGIDVRLPEHHAEAALKTLAMLEATSHVLEKDILSLDFRAPGRMVARLSADAYAARLEMLKKRKPKGLGNPT
ncbi:MAG: cell division protein FtsQ/DivIB [Hyphomicrobiales bacterium]|nr:cell division protein FtsQ/DivIB [Hyphomicrobiales bacterium]